MESTIDRKSEQLKSLKKTTEYETKYDPGIIETFENKFPKNDYVVKFVGREITSLCPITTQPDFVDHIAIIYKPDTKLVESKSLKLYLGTFRNFPAFGEDLTNTILDDLAKKIEPKWIRVVLAMRSRGGFGWTTSADWTQNPSERILDSDLKGQIIDQMHLW